TLLNSLQLVADTTQVDDERLYHSGAADRVDGPIDDSAGAKSGDRFEGVHGDSGAGVPTVGHDSARERMFGAQFERGRQGERPLSRGPAEQQKLIDLETSVRKGTGLIVEDRPNAAQPLQIGAALDERAVARSRADRRHDGNRS